MQNKERRRGDRDHNILFKGTPSMNERPFTKPLLFKFPLPPNSAEMEMKFDLWRTFKIQILTI
jgi:hypothetical protein